MTEYSIEELLRDKNHNGEFVHKKSFVFKDRDYKKEYTNFTRLCAEILQRIIKETGVDVGSIWDIVDDPSVFPSTNSRATIQQDGKDIVVNMNYGNEVKLRMMIKAFKTAYKSDANRLKQISIGFEGGNVETGNQFTPDVSISNSNVVKSEIIDMIEKGNCCQIIFTGAPGTGKTFYAKEIAGELGSSFEEGKNKGKKYELVQFHPSYDYTDFVEGLRPIQVDSNGKMEVSFAKVDGVFKRFCRDVAKENDNKQDLDKKYFFIIDEINRANLSKVFGELMFGLERDKRGSINKFSTQYQNLPTYDLEKGQYLSDDVFKDGFYIPENVVIIGTMNDIDRSVDSMDFALRRRFEWREFVVNDEMLITAFKSQRSDSAYSFGQLVADNADDIAKRVMELNDNWINSDGKAYGLNRQYYISQGQFSNISYSGNDLAGLLKYIWRYRIESLLREYLRGEEDIDKLIREASKHFLYDLE